MGLGDYFKGVGNAFDGVSDEIRSLLGATKRPGSSASPSAKSVGPNDIDPLDDVQAEVKQSKLKPGHVDKIFELVAKHGIMPGSKQFVDELGIGMEQNGMRPTGSLGPLGPIRDLFSPKAQDIIRQQTVANKIGMAALETVTQMVQRKAQGPQTLGEAQEAGLGNVVRPLSSQMKSPGPYADGLQTQPTPNADAPLVPFQQALAGDALHSLAEGRQMLTSDGIQPTSFAGGRVTPEQGEAAIKAIYPNGGITAPGVSLPTAAFDTVLRVQGDNKRNEQRRLDGPDVSNLADELALRDYNLPYKALGTAQRADVMAKKEAYTQEQVRFTQGETAKRAIAVAGPVEHAKKEADRDEPVTEPQLWRDPFTGKAASATMTTRQAQNSSFVKIRPDQVETLNQLGVIDNGLQEVKQIASKVLKPKAGSPGGEILRALGQTSYLAYLRATGDKDIVKMDSIITRLTAPLVKSQGDAANIAVAEREMFASSLVKGQASTEAVLANLDSVIESTRNARSMMGFKSREDFEAALTDSGVSKVKAVEAADKKFGKPKASNEDAMRSKIRDLRAQGKSFDEIKRLLGE